MTSSRHFKKPVLLIVVLATLAVPAALWALSAPGLTFSVEYKPDFIELPESHSESDTALYQAHKQLMVFPDRIAKINEELEQKISDLHADDSIDPVTVRDRIADLKTETTEQLKEINAQEAELRSAFIYLAMERIKQDTDPYILLALSQQYYGIRGQPPALIQNEITQIKQHNEQMQAEKAKEEAAKKDDSKNDDGEKAEKQEVEKAPEPKPTNSGGMPSMIIGRQYKTNYERILAACDEIRQRFQSFPHMDRVIRLTAACKMEMGMAEDAVYLWRELLKDYPESAYIGDTYWRMAEYQFDTPTAYDHYTTSSELYEKALQYYKQPNQDRFRLLYMRAWAKYLSPDLSEDAKDAFVQLYNEMKKAPKASSEMLSIRAEIIEVVKQIVAKRKAAEKGSAFGY